MRNAVCSDVHDSRCAVSVKENRCIVIKLSEAGGHLLHPSKQK